MAEPIEKSEIVEGHGRVLAAQRLGMETVPVIHLDALTDEQRRAYAHTAWSDGRGATC